MPSSTSVGSRCRPCRRSGSLSALTSGDSSPSWPKILVSFDLCTPLWFGVADTSLSRPTAIQKAATAERNKASKSKSKSKSKGKGKGKGKASALSDDEEDELDEDQDEDDVEEEEERVSPPKKRKAAPVISQELYGPGASPSKRRRTADESADLENNDALDALLGDDDDHADADQGRDRTPTRSHGSQKGADGDDREVTGAGQDDDEPADEVMQEAAAGAAGPGGETETGDLSL